MAVGDTAQQRAALVRADRTHDGDHVPRGLLDERRRRVARMRRPMRHARRNDGHGHVRHPGPHLGADVFRWRDHRACAPQRPPHLTDPRDIRRADRSTGEERRVQETEIVQGRHHADRAIVGEDGLGAFARAPVDAVEMDEACAGGRQLRSRRCPARAASSVAPRGLPARRCPRRRAARGGVPGPPPPRRGCSDPRRRRART